MNQPTYPLPWNTLPLGAGPHYFAVTDAETPDPRHGPVIDMKQVGRIVVTAAMRSVGTVQSIVVNALARGYDVHLGSPSDWERRYRTYPSVVDFGPPGFERRVAAYAATDKGRDSMLLELQRMVAERQTLMEHHGVEAWYELGDSVRLENGIRPCLFVGNYPDLEEDEHVQAIFDALRPSVASAAGVYQVIVLNKMFLNDPDEREDSLTAKLVLSSERRAISTTAKLIHKAFRRYSKKDAMGLSAELLTNDADLFAIGHKRPKPVDMRRANLMAAGYQFKQMGVPTREPIAF